MTTPTQEAGRIEQVGGAGSTAGDAVFLPSAGNDLIADAVEARSTGQPK